MYTFSLGFLDQMDPWMWGTAFAVLTIMVLLVPRMLQKKKLPARSAPSESSRHTSDRIQLSLEKLMVELFDMSRDINGQLETRITTLHELIRQADNRIQELRRVSGQSIFSDTSSTISMSDLKASAPRQKPLLKTFTSADPEHQKIYALADQGMSLSEISRTSGRPLGEVQLILDLRRAEK
jgi:hypothetical protein